MSIPLTSDQQELAYRRALAEVKLLKIVTYSDRVAETVGTTFWLSDETAYYDYGNAGTDRTFEPLLVSVDLAPRTMSHVPEPGNDGIDSAITATMRVRLKNEDVRGQRLLARLKTYPIEFATVEYATVLVDPATKASSALPYRDMRALTGDEHVVRFRGTVGRMLQASDDTIDLEFRTEAPEIPWLYFDDATKNDPKDLGQRMPIVYGNAQKVRGGGWTVGHLTTLSEGMSDTQTGIVNVTDGTGFPSGTFEIMASGERIQCTAKTDTTITIGTRGYLGTKPAYHLQGEPITESITEVAYIFAGHECSAINDVYARNPFTGNVFKIKPSLVGTLDPADTTLVSGETVASLRFTADEMVDLQIDMFQQAVVAQEATYVLGGEVETGNLTPDAVGGDGSHTYSVLNDGNTGTGLRIAEEDGTAPDYVKAQFSTGYPYADPWVSQTVRFHIDGDLTSSGASVNEIQVWVGDYSDTPYNSNGNATHIGTVAKGAASGWYEFTTSIESDAFFLRHETSSAGGSFGVTINEMERRVTTELNGLVQGDPTVIAAASVGYGLELFADVDGYEVPAANTTYSVAAGSLITKPGDVIHHFLAELCGLGDAAVDHTGTFDDAITNLGASALACDIRGFGFGFADILQRLAYESRANVISVERVAGTLWKMLTALSSYAFPAATKTLTGSAGAYEIGRDILELGTRWTGYSDFNVETDTADEAAFTRIARASSVAADHDLTLPSNTDIGNAEAEIGIRRMPHLFFLGIYDAATLDEVMGYYVHEGISRRRVFDLRVDHNEGYDLERGDVVSWTPPWESVAAKCRVIETLNSDADGVRVRLAEVE